MSAPKSKKVAATRVQTSIRARFNPIKGLTPEKLGSHLEAFDRGELRQFALAADKIRRRDPQIGSVSGKRERAVALLDYEILTTEESPAAQEQKAALEYLYDNLRVGSAVDGNQTGGFSLLVKQMMRAVGDKYACHEIIWKPESGTTARKMSVELVYVPLWFFENTTGRLRFLESDYALGGTELEPDGWLVTVGEGLMEATSVAYIFKNLSLKDWVYYSEKFGLPGIHGKTDAAQDSEDWKRFVEAVANFGNDFGIVTNMSGEIKELAFGAKGEMPMPKLVDYMDRSLSILWRGGDLSTISAGGGAVGSNPQDEEKDDIAEADALMVSETLNEQIDRPALRYLFGTARPLAYVRIRPKSRPNVVTEIATDTFLIAAGVPIAQAELAERYGRTAAAPDAVLARAPAPAPSPFGGANVAAYSLEELKAAATPSFNERLATALAVPDEAGRRAALRALSAELPATLRAIPSGDPAARLLEAGMAAAVVAGATAAAKKLPSAK